MTGWEVVQLVGTFSVLLLAFGFVSDYFQDKKKKPEGGASGTDKRN